MDKRLAEWAWQALVVGFLVLHVSVPAVVAAPDEAVLASASSVTALSAPQQSAFLSFETMLLLGLGLLLVLLAQKGRRKNKTSLA